MFRNFNLVFEHANEAVFLIRVASKRIQACNAKAEEFFGYTAHDMVERSIEVLHATTEQFQRLARELDISPRTVEVYRASMLRKLNVQSTSQLWSLLVLDA